MPNPSDPAYFLEPSEYSLLLARTAGAQRPVVIEELREVALSEKAAVEEIMREISAGKSDALMAAIRPAQRLHLATSDEARHYQTPAALQKFATESPKFADEQHGWFAITPAREGSGAPWLLAATAPPALTQSLGVVTDLQVKPSNTFDAALYTGTAVAGALKLRKDAAPVLCLDLGATSSHAMVVSAGGIEAVTPTALSIDAIAEAVQAELGLKFKGSAAKLFFNGLYDFSEVSEKIAIRLKTALGATLEGLSPSPAELYCAGLPSRQQWLCAQLATTLGLPLFVPDMRGWCSANGIIFSNSTIEGNLSPAWLGFLNFISVQCTAPSAWSAGWTSLDAPPPPALLPSTVPLTKPAVVAAPAVIAAPPPPPATSAPAPKISAPPPPAPPAAVAPAPVPVPIPAAPAPRRAEAVAPPPATIPPPPAIIPPPAPAPAIAAVLAPGATIPPMAPPPPAPPPVKPKASLPVSIPPPPPQRTAAPPPAGPAKPAAGPAPAGKAPPPAAIPAAAKVTAPGKPVAADAGAKTIPPAPPLPTKGAPKPGLPATSKPAANAPGNQKVAPSAAQIKAGESSSASYPPKSQAPAKGTPGKPPPSQAPAGKGAPVPAAVPAITPAAVAAAAVPTIPPSKQPIVLPSARPSRTTPPMPVPVAPKKTRTTLVIIAIVILLLLVGVAYYFWQQNAEADRVAAEKARQEQLAHDEAERIRLAAQKVAEQAAAKKKSDADAAQKAAAIATAHQQAEADAAAQAAAHAAAARGSISVTTDPAGATVTVGALAPQRSPATFGDLKLGKYPVLVTLPQHDEMHLELEVKENTTTDSGLLHLVRPVGKLELATEPAGANFELHPANALMIAPEARRTGSTPALIGDLTPGDYSVTFTRAGAEAHTATVTVNRDATVRTTYAFPLGSVRISSIPDGAAVTRAGANLGVTPLLIADLSPGDVEYIVALDGYENSKISGHIDSGKTLALNTALRSMDRVVGMNELEQKPEIISAPSPQIPARLTQLGGRVELELVVTREGTTREIKIVQTPNPEVAKLCIAAASEWKFRPGLIGGKPVNVRVVVPFLIGGGTP